jgi:hypothetical protein
VNSPLGKYSQAVAAGIAVGVIGAYLVAIFVRSGMGLDHADIENLKILALIAVGAVFGSAATINGVKAPLDSAHTRIDKIESATGIPTHSTDPAQPVQAHEHDKGKVSQ